MAKKQKKEKVYKFQITHLLLLLLEIAGHDSKYAEDFEEAYRKRLKFQKQTDWKRFRACVDLLDDTENAIISVFQYQLGDLSNNNKDFGETNLRLYGILNAVYLQMSAFIEIAKLLNFPEIQKINNTFKNLDVYKLRGIAGAHTVDYIYDKQTILDQKGINKTTSFRIIQMHLEKTGKNINVLDENNITFEFNLLNILSEYEKIATDLLVKLINHSVKTLVFDKQDKTEINKRLKELLSNLYDYSKIDENRKYWDKMIKTINRKAKKLEYHYLTLKEVEMIFKESAPNISDIE
jgi:hypothetical protein